MNKEKKVKKTTIGGQALIEGILMRGPKRTMTVVRKADGELVKKMDNTGTNSRGKFCKLPFIRGIFGFWDSMKYGRFSNQLFRFLFRGGREPRQV